MNSTSLHQAIHRSLGDGDFEGAERFSAALGEAVALEAARVATPERAALLQKSLERLQEHLSLAQVLRAHVASQLQTNTAVCLYQSDADNAHCWRFDA